MSIRKQCELLNVPRSGLYYKACPMNEYNLKIMNMVDEEYTRHPDMGVPSMTAYLRDAGFKCGPKRVRRLMRLMGLEAIYPKPRLSVGNKQHVIYPYLLRDVEINCPNQVWSTDITYVRLKHGYVYLVAIMDWYSRAVLSWRLSNTLDASFCCEALQEALDAYGTPEIFNTDQGSQFTCEAFTSILTRRHVSISMDGRGRALDNVFIERLWRTVKYTDVYIKGYETISETQLGLIEFFDRYNHRRLHQGLGYKRPWDVYTGVTENRGSYPQIHSIHKEEKRSKKEEMATTAISYSE